MFTGLWYLEPISLTPTTSPTLILPRLGHSSNSLLFSLSPNPLLPATDSFEKRSHPKPRTHGNLSALAYVLWLRTQPADLALELLWILCFLWHANHHALLWQLLQQPVSSQPRDNLNRPQGPKNRTKWSRPSTGLEKTGFMFMELKRLGKGSA